MKLVPVAVALGALVVVGAIAYPPAHATYVRRVATQHLRDAEALAAKMTSPVARQRLGSAADALSLAMRRSTAEGIDIRPYDAALVRLMNQLKEAPPPDRPIDVTATYETSAIAGKPFEVRVSVRSTTPEIYLVRVSADLMVGGVRTGVAFQRVDRLLDAELSNFPLSIAIPPNVSGDGRLRVNATYRLSATGEGQDLQASPQSPLHVITIAPK